MKEAVTSKHSGCSKCEGCVLGKFNTVLLQCCLARLKNELKCALPPLWPCEPWLATIRMVLCHSLWNKPDTHTHKKTCQTNLMMIGRVLKNYLNSITLCQPCLMYLILFYTESWTQRTLQAPCSPKLTPLPSYTNFAFQINHVTWQESFSEPVLSILKPAHLDLVALIDLLAEPCRWRKTHILEWDLTLWLPARTEGHKHT